MNKQQLLEEVKNEIKNNKRVPILNDVEKGTTATWQERPWAVNHEANNGMGIELTQIARHVYCSAVIFGLNPCPLDNADETVIQQVVETLFANPRDVYGLPVVSVDYYKAVLDLTCKLDVEELSIQDILLEFGLKDSPQVGLTVRVINALSRAELETLDLLLVLKSGRSLFDLARIDKLIGVLADKDTVGVLKEHPYSIPRATPDKDTPTSSCERHPGMPTRIRRENARYDFSMSLVNVARISRTRCKIRVRYTALRDVSVDALSEAISKGVISTCIGELASGALQWVGSETLKAEGAVMVTYLITSRNLFKQRGKLSLAATGPYVIRGIEDISQHASITVLADSLGNCIRALEKNTFQRGGSLQLETRRYGVPSMVIPLEVVREDDNGSKSINTELNIHGNDITSSLSIPFMSSGIEVGKTKITVGGVFLGRFRTFEINI